MKDNDPWLQRLTKWTSPKKTVAILQKDGTIARPKQAAGTAPNPNGGLHVIEAGARYWLDRPIPVGWLTVYVEGDPEPVTTREPKGYGPRTLEMLVGKYTLHLIGGGMKKPLTLANINKPALVAIGVFVAVMAIAFLIIRRRG